MTNRILSQPTGAIIAVIPLVVGFRALLHGRSCAPLGLSTSWIPRRRTVGR